MTQTQDTIGYLLSQLCRFNHRQMRTRMADLGLHRGQLFVFFALWEKEGITQSELGASLYVKPATVTNMLQRMQKGGFIERKPDPKDQRIWRVYLTEAGRDIHDEVQAEWNQFDAQLLTGLSNEDQIVLRRLLQQVRENLVDKE